MAANGLSITQILCASLEELKDYAIAKEITLPSSATKPAIQGLFIAACSKSDETEIFASQNVTSRCRTGRFSSQTRGRESSSH